VPELSRAATARLRGSLANARFTTAAGPEAVADFLAVADDRVRARTGREPTPNQLDKAVRFIASERPVIFHVADKTIESTLAEFAQRTTPPARPEIVVGLLYEGARTGVFTFDPTDGSFTVATSITDAVDQASNFSDWADEIEASRSRPAGRRLIEMHPTRAGAVSVIIPDNPTPPVDVPLVLLDLGFGEASLDKVTAISEELFRQGLAPVRSLNEVYPAVFSWSYHVTPNPDPAKNRIVINAGGQPGPVVYDGILLTNPKWLRIEKKVGAIVLAIGNFSFLDHDPYGPGFVEHRVQRVTNATLAAGRVMGATVRR
jgi:hypothetical protein